VISRSGDLPIFRPKHGCEECARDRRVWVIVRRDLELLDYLINIAVLASLSAFKKSNLLGAGNGVYVCYHLEKYCRRKREVQAYPSSPKSKADTTTKTSAVDLEAVSPPFNIQLALGLDSESDEENESGTQLLPLHNDSNTSPPHCPGKPTTTRRAKRSARCELGAGRR